MHLTFEELAALDKACKLSAEQGHKVFCHRRIKETLDQMRESHIASLREQLDAVSSSAMKEIQDLMSRWGTDLDKFDEIKDVIDNSRLKTEKLLKQMHWAANL